MDTNVVRRRLAEEWERLLETKAAIEQVGAGAAPLGDGLGEPASLDQDAVDAGNEVLEREVELSVRERVDADLRAIGDAYARLDAGRYGSCDTCGGAIDDERLVAMPATRFCRAHEQAWELDTVALVPPEPDAEPEAASAVAYAERDAIRHLDLVEYDDLDLVNGALEREELELSAEEAALHVVAGGRLDAADLDGLEQETAS